MLGKKVSHFLLSVDTQQEVLFSFGSQQNLVSDKHLNTDTEGGLGKLLSS